MRHWISCVAAALLIALLIGCGKGTVNTSVDMAGNYEGLPTWSTAVGVIPTSLILVLHQSGNTLSGTYSSSVLVFHGSVAGIVSGNTATVTLTEDTGTPAGTLQGTLQQNGADLNVSLSGTVSGQYGAVSVNGLVGKQN